MILFLLTLSILSLSGVHLVRLLKAILLILMHRLPSFTHEYLHFSLRVVSFSHGPFLLILSIKGIKIIRVCRLLVVRDLVIIISMDLLGAGGHILIIFLLGQ